MAKVKINCYNRASEKAVRNQLRDKKGKFTKGKFTFYLSSIVIILLITFIGANWNKVKVEYVQKVQAQTIVVDTTKKIIDQEKADILSILKDCESKGDADAIVWIDGGFGKNAASFGAYMFKVGTIQKFTTGLSDFQAISLASNESQARQLASRIIFETPAGIYNWTNCMIKNDLLSRVNFVKELESKIKEN